MDDADRIAEIFKNHEKRLEELKAKIKTDEEKVKARDAENLNVDVK